jgi:hypothetical protein
VDTLGPKPPHLKKLKTLKKRTITHDEEGLDNLGVPPEIDEKGNNL